jgi:hypothetical protein
MERDISVKNVEISVFWLSDAETNKQKYIKRNNKTKHIDAFPKKVIQCCSHTCRKLLGYILLFTDIQNLYTSLAFSKDSKKYKILSDVNNKSDELIAVPRWRLIQLSSCQYSSGVHVELSKYYFRLFQQRCTDTWRIWLLLLLKSGLCASCCTATWNLLRNATISSNGLLSYSLWIILLPIQ